VRKIEQDRLVREDDISIRLLDGVLAGIDEDIEKEIALIANRGPEKFLDPVIIEAAWKSISKPALTVVWEQLGRREPKWVSDYISMDRKIEKAWCQPRKDNVTINAMLDELRTLRQTVIQLRGALHAETEKVRK